MIDMIDTIIYSSLLPFMALIVLFFMTKHNYLFNKKQTKLFRIAIIMNLILLVVISLDGIFSMMYNPNIWIFRNLTSCINFAFSPLTPLILYRIFLAEHQPRKLFYLPFIVNTLVCIASMFCKLVFDITPDNSYGRGSLFFLPFLVSLFYMGVLILYLRASAKKGNRGERIFLCGVVVLLIFFMGMEIIGGYRFLTWDAAVVSLILYYLLININNANHDPLTGAFNRAMYMKELSNIEHSASCTIALLDINNFKTINDTLGHDEGDKFLVLMVKILQMKLDKNAAVYRIGGDEFVILSKKWNGAMMQDYLRLAREEANGQRLDFAYGIAVYKPEQSLEKALKIADQNMYICKNKTKEKSI